ncbi:MAG: T9SS type A sorting domain-containing protein [Flavobacteriales bacterium]|nr:T9SS type A sorting domain-containing protein [Flavobacteriales bacterium]
MAPSVRAQSFESFRWIEDPNGDPGFGRAVQMDNSVLVVSGMGDGGGVVHAFTRHEGGLDEWGLASSIWPEEDQQGGFGNALQFVEDRLIVGGEQGSWEYGWNDATDRFTLRSRIDTFPATSISVFEDRMAISSQGPLMSFSGVVNFYHRIANGENTWQLDLLRPVTHVPYASLTCTGSASFLHGDHFLVSDTCNCQRQQDPSINFSQVYAFRLDPVDHLPPLIGSIYGSLSLPRSVGRRYGSALSIRGDTLFIGWNGPGSEPTSWVEVYRIESNAYVRLDSLRPIQDPVLVPNGRTGYAILADRPGPVFVGAENSLMVHREAPGGGWELTETLGPTDGAVQALARNEDLIAAGVPEDGSGNGHIILYRDLSVGLHWAEEPPAFSIVPVPADEQVQITFHDVILGSAELILFNALGKKVRSIPLNGQRTFPIARLGLDAGLYIVHLLDSNGATEAIGRLFWQ